MAKHSGEVGREIWVKIKVRIFIKGKLLGREYLMSMVVLLAIILVK